MSSNTGFFSLPGTILHRCSTNRVP